MNCEAAAAAERERGGDDAPCSSSSSSNAVGTALVIAIPASRLARFLWRRRAALAGVAIAGPGVVGRGLARTALAALAASLLPGGWRAVQGLALLGCVPLAAPGAQVSLWRPCCGVGGRGVNVGEAAAVSEKEAASACSCRNIGNRERNARETKTPKNTPRGTARLPRLHRREWWTPSTPAPAQNQVTARGARPTLPSFSPSPKKTNKTDTAPPARGPGRRGVRARARPALVPGPAPPLPPRARHGAHAVDVDHVPAAVRAVQVSE
jgi:hypothetical protein